MTKAGGYLASAQLGFGERSFAALRMTKAAAQDDKAGRSG